MSGTRKQTDAQRVFGPVAGLAFVIRRGLRPVLSPPPTRMIYLFRSKRAEDVQFLWVMVFPDFPVHSLRQLLFIHVYLGSIQTVALLSYYHLSKRDCHYPKSQVGQRNKTSLLASTAEFHFIVPERGKNRKRGRTGMDWQVSRPGWSCPAGWQYALRLVTATQ